MAERRVRASRTIRVTPALLPDALLRLRREHNSPVTRWTLGDHGSIEVDAWFAPADDGHQAAGWLFGPDGDVVRVRIVATPGRGTSRLSLQVLVPLPACWEREPEALSRLVGAALSELAEEVCWQAGRTEHSTV